MTAVVTATRPYSYDAGSIRNAPRNGRSDAVTDECPDKYDAGQASVTCTSCGSVIPDHRPIVIPAYTTRTHQAGKPVCESCASANPYFWPWSGYSCTYPQSAYSRRCARCRRWFIGAIGRRYCSDGCGEAERNGRRDRTADRIPRACETCGDTFTPPRSDGRYCSPACRQKAYRQRHIRPGISDPGRVQGGLNS